MVCSYNCEISTDGTGRAGKRVRGTKNGTTGLDDVTTLPDHGAHGSGTHVCDETLKEGLVREVGVVLLEVLLGGGHELDGCELKAMVWSDGVLGLVVCIGRFWRTLCSRNER